MNTTIVKNPLPLDLLKAVTLAQKKKRNKKTSTSDRQAFVQSPAPEESHDSNADAEVLVERDQAEEEESWAIQGDLSEASGQFDLPGLSGLFDYLEARLELRKHSLSLPSIPIHLRAPHFTFAAKELIEGFEACGYQVVTADQLKVAAVKYEKPPLLVLIRHYTEWESYLESVWTKYPEDVVCVFWSDSPQPPTVEGKNWLVFDLFSEPNRSVLINTLWGRLATELGFPEVDVPYALACNLQQLPDCVLETALVVLANAVKRGQDFDQSQQLYSLPFFSNLNPDAALLGADLKKIQEACFEVFNELNHRGSGVQCFVRNKNFWQVIVVSPDPLLSKATRMSFSIEGDSNIQFTLESPDKISIEIAAELVAACNAWNFRNARCPAVVVQVEAGIVIQQYLQFDLQGLTVERFKSGFEKRLTNAMDFWRDLKLQALGDGE